MRKELEGKWVSFINSNWYRKFAKRKLVATFLKSNIYRSANTYRRYTTTFYKTKKCPKLFQEVESFCFFIGQTKSGCSMVGGLLDAHPHIIISDEVDALQYVPLGFSREQIFLLLLHTSNREMMKGRVTARRLKPYNFLVPDQWQGKYSNLLAIGDSTAGKTTQRLAKNPELIRELESVMKELTVKVIQVIRNPFDPISVMMIRGKRTFENASEHYFRDCKTLVELRGEINSENLFSIRYEDFVSSPKYYLTELCSFLGTVASGDYLDACAGILSDSPEKSRSLVDWNQSRIDQVQSKIDQYDFLQGYSYLN